MIGQSYLDDIVSGIPEWMFGAEPAELALSSQIEDLMHEIEGAAALRDFGLCNAVSASSRIRISTAEAYRSTVADHLVEISAGLAGEPFSGIEAEGVFGDIEPLIKSELWVWEFTESLAPSIFGLQEPTDLLHESLAGVANCEVQLLIDLKSQLQSSLTQVDTELPQLRPASIRAVAEYATSLDAKILDLECAISQSRMGYQAEVALCTGDLVLEPALSQIERLNECLSEILYRGFWAASESLDALYCPDFQADQITPVEWAGTKLPADTVVSADPRLLVVLDPRLQRWMPSDSEIVTAVNWITFNRFMIEQLPALLCHEKQPAALLPKEARKKFEKQGKGMGECDQGFWKEFISNKMDPSEIVKLARNIVEKRSGTEAVPKEIRDSRFVTKIVNPRADAVHGRHVCEVVCSENRNSLLELVHIVISLDIEGKKSLH